MSRSWMDLRSGIRLTSGWGAAPDVPGPLRGPAPLVHLLPRPELPQLHQRPAPQAHHLIIDEHLSCVETI